MQLIFCISVKFRHIVCHDLSGYEAGIDMKVDLLWHCELLNSSILLYSNVRFIKIVKMKGYKHMKILRDTGRLEH